MAEPLQIAIVDDHPLFRAGVAEAIGRFGAFTVIAEGENADQAVAIAAQRLPDVMLLDVSMPGGGVNAVKRIALDAPVPEGADALRRTRGDAAALDALCERLRFGPLTRTRIKELLG